MRLVPFRFGIPILSIQICVKSEFSRTESCLVTSWKLELKNQESRHRLDSRKFLGLSRLAQIAKPKVPIDILLPPWHTKLLALKTAKIFKKFALSTLNQGFPHHKSVQNLRPADSNISYSQTNKTPRAFAKCSVDDIRVCISLSSRIWQGFWGNWHTNSESRADKGATNTVARISNHLNVWMCSTDRACLKLVFVRCRWWSVFPFWPISRYRAEHTYISIL